MRLFNIWIKPKKINHKILKHFLKKTDAGGRFFILFFISSKTDAGRRFVVFFLKNRRGMYLHEPLYSPTMFHGRCTTCTAPDDICTDTRAMLDMKSDDFLEKRPFRTSRWKTPL